MAIQKNRCPWVNYNNALYVKYHDEEWGRPVHDDNRLFEMITLEGAQAGLSWETILKKRAHYRKVFLNFDPKKVARFTTDRIAELLDDPGIVRNRLKVESTMSNAKAFMNIQNDFGTFDNYIWNFVDNQPIYSEFHRLRDYPATTTLSDIISKDLKKRGFRFVGSTITYAFMQAIGMVNDHTINCFRFGK